METAYTIQELSSLSGVSIPTIKYYRRLRMLSETLPLRGNADGRHFYIYTGTHVRELRRIREILENNRTLEDIRDMLRYERGEIAV